MSTVLSGFGFARKKLIRALLWKTREINTRIFPRFNQIISKGTVLLKIQLHREGKWHLANYAYKRPKGSRGILFEVVRNGVSIVFRQEIVTGPVFIA